MGLSDLDRCSIARWYPKLRQRTIRTTFIALPDAFIDYLLADRVYVPDAGDPPEGDSSSDEDERNQEEGDWESTTSAVPRFPDIEKAITAAIDEFGGGCFPKLNWSAPLDAAWILGGSLKCASATPVCARETGLLLIRCREQAR